MKTMRCLIVDDEPLALDVIENYLSRLKDIETTRCSNAVDAVQVMKQQSFDLIFLDIEMPMLTGFDFLRTIKDPPAVIITTAYRDYAVEGFEYEVTDYLVKPISFPRFMKAFERAVKHMDKTDEAQESSPSSEFLFLKVDRKLLKIVIDDILFVESMKDYIRVSTNTENYICYQSLTSITEKLPADKFMRIHRSFTVALDKIDSVDGNCIVIRDALIPISRELKQDVLRLLKSR